MRVELQRLLALLFASTRSDVYLACRSAMLASFIVVVVVVVAVAVVLVVAVYKRSLSKRTTVIQESILGAEQAQAGEPHS